ncbi:hypothetical protein DOY81_007670 [Sarcophaga bullata]|nr:hypothetical protein DOY81_007670 [Sarcophaga bullata]
MKFLAVGTFLAICGLALAAPSYHHGDGGHGTSYAFITKHDWIPHHHGWEEKSWGSDNGWHGGASVGHHYDGGWDKHDYDKHAKYEFDYGVKDLKTGDIKNQWEHRDGDHVKGSYSLKESDGTTRIVDYSADDHSGFNAVVKKIGHAYHPEPVHHYSGGWDHGYDHGHGHGHGHASSYVKVKQY